MRVPPSRELRAELATLLADRAALMASVFGDAEAARRWLDQADDQAEVLAEGLGTEGEDQRVAAATVLALKWGDAQPPATWWGTVLGQAVAATRTDEEPVTPKHAAMMLVVTPARIHQLRDGGQLIRHHRGGVTLSSVLNRITATGRPARWTVPALIDGDGEGIGPLDAPTLDAVREEISTHPPEAPAVVSDTTDAPILLVDGNGRPLTAAAAIALIDHIASTQRDES